MDNSQTKNQSKIWSEYEKRLYNCYFQEIFSHTPLILASISSVKQSVKLICNSLWRTHIPKSAQYPEKYSSELLFSKYKVCNTGKNQWSRTQFEFDHGQLIYQTSFQYLKWLEKESPYNCYFKYLCHTTTTGHIVGCFVD